MARIVKYDEELLINNVEKMARDLLSAFQCEEEIVLDLSKVNAIDTAAIQVLLALRKEFEMHGREFCCLTSTPVKNFADSIGCPL